MVFPNLKTVFVSSCLVCILSVLFYNKFIQNLNSNLSSIIPGSKNDTINTLTSTVEYLDHHYDNHTNPSGIDHNHNYAASNYFNIATEFFEWGWGDAIHMSPVKPGLSFKESMNLWEYKFVSILNISDTSKVVDMGMGVGGPLRRIIEFTGASVTGVSNVPYHIERAEYITNNPRITSDYVKSRAKYILHDYNNVSSLKSNSYDFVYFMESLAHSNNRTKPLLEAYRLLKPGGIVGAWQWMLKDNFDNNNKEHQFLKYRMELGGGLSNLNKAYERTIEFNKAGFNNILYSYDMNELALKLGWESFWKPLNEGHDLQSRFTSSYFGRYLTMFIAWFTEFIGIAEKGTYNVARLLEHCADATVKLGKIDAFTPLHLHVAQKPFE